MDSPNKDICKECGAFCCRYAVYPKNHNHTKECIEYHDAQNSLIKKDDDFWILDRPCPHVQDDHTCGIYETRPKFCATYPTDLTHEHWFKFCELMRNNPPKRKGQLQVLK